MAICWATMKQTLKETCWCFLLLPPPSSLPPFPSLPLEFFDSNTLGEVVGDLPGLTDGDIKGNLMGLFDSNMLGEANGNWLGLTDGDFEGNLLGLFDSNALGEANGDLLGLADGDFEDNLLGLFDGNALGDEGKDAIDGNKSVSPFFFLTNAHSTSQPPSLQEQEFHNFRTFLQTELLSETICCHTRTQGFISRCSSPTAVCKHREQAGRLRLVSG